MGAIDVWQSWLQGVFLEELRSLILMGVSFGGINGLYLPTALGRERHRRNIELIVMVEKKSRGKLAVHLRHLLVKSIVLSSLP